MDAGSPFATISTSPPPAFLSRRSDARPFDPSSPEAMASVRIQAAVRGMLVRSAMKAVAAIEAEVDEIQTSIIAAAAGGDEEEGTVRSNTRERLRVSEMLMKILFRLDSVRGVRDYRRRVIRKVVFLQDLVDSIDGGNSGSERCDLVAEFGDLGETCEDEFPAPIFAESQRDQEGEVVDNKINNQCIVEEFAIRDNSGTSVVDENLETGICAGILKEEEGSSDEGFVLLSVEEFSVVNSDANSVEVVGIQGETMIEKAIRKVDSGADGALMIDGMAENEKILQVVKDFCDKQTRMMSELADRVERLENVIKRMGGEESCNL